MRLRESLHELADEARSYADPDAAVTRARRRRARSVAVPLSVAAVVLGGLVAAGLPWLPAEPPVQVDPRYPARVSPRDGAVPLPADRAVGAASYVYGRCASTCQPVLVLPDGTQYAIPASPDHGSIAVALSPDGRRLGWANRNEFRLRDLYGTQENVYTGKSIWTGARWSPNGRWLVLMWSGQGEYTIIDTTNGRTTWLATPPWSWFDVSDTGEWLLFPIPYEAGYDRLDAPTGEATHHKLAPSLGQAGEYPLPPLLTPCSCTAMFPLFPSGPVDPYIASGPVVALVDVDLADGHVITRFDLPQDDGTWRPVAVLPDEGVVLAHFRPDVTEVVQLHSITGELTVVSRLPAGFEVVLRGAGFPAGR
jgi:hypothetical protein